ncbi:MAG TPA: hypothetical protein PLG87_03515 [Treponemataceae bacterium]|nr:hypothetical protein [Treponemataceae bacterium]
MDKHMYLSLMPEALIISQLPPEEFGSYYSVGPELKTQGQALFFEIDPSYRDPFFQIDNALSLCIPHSDSGKPKRSVYCAVYRVVEHIPVSALGKLYLVTKDGRTLGIDHSKFIPEDEAGLHLYHEIAPLHPLVVSTLGPKAFHSFFMGDSKKNIAVPALCWVECRLGELAINPEFGDVKDLPYENIDHLRNCLIQLKTKNVVTKIVDRLNPTSFAYRTIQNGIFYGSGKDLAMFPLPSIDELKKDHYQWWRSANM